MIDKGHVFQNLISIAYENGLEIKFFGLKQFDGLLVGRRIGIRSGMNIDDINYNLAHELAHFFLHYDKGNILESKKQKEYEEQADRAATLLLCAINTVLNVEGIL